MASIYQTVDQGNLLPGSDAELEAAIADANLPTLLMALACMTGDDRWLADNFAPKPIEAPEGSLFPDDTGQYSQVVADQIRAEALAVLQAVRDGKQTLESAPTVEQFHRMMAFAVAEPIERSYAEMLMEEIGFTERDDVWRQPLAQSVQKAAAEGGLEQFNVVIIGAGMSGIGMAIKLKEAGIPFEIIEKNDAVGGTWYENSYPDCGVDTPNHFYSYSFDRNPNWSGYFSKRDELWAYFEDCSRKHGVRDSITFSTEVISSIYNTKTQQWDVRTRAADGTEQQLTANIVVSAVGQLNRPMLPDINGLDDFSGPAFHSARWQHEHDLTGKKVAVVGTGCSAVQLLPKTAEKAAEVDVFQRSPHWVSPSRDYYRKVETGLIWALNHIPYYAEWHRARMIFGFGDRSWPAVNKDPDWPHLDRSMNEMNEGFRLALTEYIRTELGPKADLAAACTPDFPVWGKRLIVDNGWYQTLARDNVNLVTQGIREVVADGVITDDGSHHAADVLILATGFRTSLFLWPMDVVGKSGKSLADAWGDTPEAYQGITVPDFPNLFCLYGPNTNIVHGGSIVYQVECQIHYIMQCISAMFDKNIQAMEVRPEVNSQYNADVQEISRQLAWGHDGVESWYKNSDGKVVNNSPFSLHRYWEVTHDLNLDDYLLEYEGVNATA